MVQPDNLLGQSDYIYSQRMIRIKQISRVALAIVPNFIVDRIVMTRMDILRLFRESQPTPEIVPFEELLLQTITQHPGLNAPTLAERLGKSLRTTQRYLKILSEKKLIRFQGVAKKGGYVAV